MNDQQLEAIAQAVAALRAGSWDLPGIRAALTKARDKGTAEEVLVAAVRAAITPGNRTPAVIAMDGPHWRPLTSSAPARIASGTVPRPQPAPWCGDCDEETRRITTTVQMAGRTRHMPTVCPKCHPYRNEIPPTPNHPTGRTETHSGRHGARSAR